MPTKNNIPKWEQMAAELLKDAVTYVEVSGLNFFKDRFYQGGWYSNVFEPWTPLKNGRDGILQKTGNLRESIRVLEATPLRVVFGTSALQAEIHNIGGTITVTEKMKKFFWAMYIKAAGIQKTETGKTNWKDETKMQKNDDGGYKVSEQNRQIGLAAQYWRGLALKKVGSQIKIPKRQFIGESQHYMQQLDNWIAERIQSTIKKL